MDRLHVFRALITYTSQITAMDFVVKDPYVVPHRPPGALLHREKAGIGQTAVGCFFAAVDFKSIDNHIGGTLECPHWAGLRTIIEDLAGIQGLAAVGDITRR